MTDEELERMRAYAEAAAKDLYYPSSVAYAQDVPKLLAEIEYLRTRRLWHRLRFAEMVLDRIGGEIDGVPWREAARLNEALDGEPVTDAVPVEKRLGECQHAIATLEGLLSAVAHGEVTSHGYRPPTAMNYVTVKIDEDIWGCIRSATWRNVTEPVAVLTEESPDIPSPVQLMRETLTHIAYESDMTVQGLQQWALGTLQALWPSEFTPVPAASRPIAQPGDTGVSSSHGPVGTRTVESAKGTRAKAPGDSHDLSS